jgi:hypothetical protein
LHHKWAKKLLLRKKTRAKILLAELTLERKSVATPGILNKNSCQNSHLIIVINFMTAMSQDAVTINVPKMKA